MPEPAVKTGELGFEPRLTGSESVSRGVSRSWTFWFCRLFFIDKPSKNGDICSLTGLWDR